MTIALSSIDAFAAAAAHARTIDFAAYTLRPGAVLDALVAAARAGAGVRVRLERDPYDDAAGSLHQANIAAVARLRAAGAEAALRGPAEPILHMKAAVVDGTAWLDDRNWAGGGRETVVCDSDPDDVVATAAALRGAPGANAHLRTTKAGASWLEADVVRAAGAGALSVASESFGAGAVEGALLARARAGLPTRLLVAGREATAPGSAGDRERRSLARLAALGVEVRTGVPGGNDVDEKLAVTAGAAWVGSANATYARGSAGEQRDWGLTTDDPALVGGLRAAYQANWDAARPFSGASSAASAAGPDPPRSAR